MLLLNPPNVINTVLGLGDNLDKDYQVDYCISTTVRWET